MSIYVGTLAATSNRVKWTFAVEIIDPVDPDTAVDLVGSTILLGIREPGQQQCILSGSLSDAHAVLTSPGNFNVTFTEAEMKILAPGEYDFGLVLKLANGTQHQLIAGQLPVVDGVVNP